MIGFRISKQEPSELRAGFLSSNRCPSKEEVNRGNRGNSCWKSSYKQLQGQERYKDSPAPRVSKGLAFPSTSIMDIRTFVMEATGDKST